MYNALRETDKLIEAGFTEDQARETVRVIMNTLDENMVTKVDLQEVDNRLGNQIVNVEYKLTSRINEMESKLTAQITEVENKLSSRIDKLESSINANIENLKHEMNNKETRLFIRLASFVVIAIGAIPAITKLLMT